MGDVTHFFIRLFSVRYLGSFRPSGALPPHPFTLEKSLPVPKGITPRGTLSYEIPYLCISWSTHITVPSPPPDMTLQVASPESDIFLSSSIPFSRSVSDIKLNIFKVTFFKSFPL
jgi:hypothetical protein